MILVNARQTGAPLSRPWKRGIAVGRAFDLQRADLLEHLRWLQREIGFDSCRFHSVLHDDMAVVQRAATGRLAFQWHQVDKVYDSLLSLGLRPFVELNPMPAAIASGSQTMFRYAMNVTPPRLWEEWEEVIEAFASHCVDRYGLDEVARWHFEVWNEPNLSAFWSGTKAEYFELYTRAARAVKRVSPRLRIGGPASSKAHWLDDLIEHCRLHGVPLDFLSTHLYPQDEFVEHADRTSSPHAPGAFFQDVVRRARADVTASAGAQMPLHWTEWNTQLATHAGDVTWGENRHVDSLHGASFVARQMVELDDAADSFMYWVASDIFEEGPLPQTPFSQTYGLLTIHGVPKAAANAFRLLECLRGPRASVETVGLPLFCGAIATCEGGSVHVLAWHDLPPGLTAPVWNDTLRLIPPAALATAPGWIVTSAHVRSGQGSPLELWESMGSPANVSAAQLACLRSRAEPARDAMRLNPTDGELIFPLSLAPNEILHLEFRPADSRPHSAAMSPEEAARLEAQLGERSRL